MAKRAVSADETMPQKDGFFDTGVRSVHGRGGAFAAVRDKNS